MDIQEIMQYVLETPENTNPAILKKMLESLSSEGGGGGDSDFSTATVTFLNSLGDGDRGAYYTNLMCVLSDGLGVSPNNVVRNGELTLTVPLYKGKASIPLPIAFRNFDDEIQPQFTGDIELSGLDLVITGDCTLNAAGISIS